MITCKCKLEAKLVEVKKEGANKGRKFYACPRPQAEQCDFFEWADKKPDMKKLEAQALTNIMLRLDKLEKKLDTRMDRLAEYLLNNLGGAYRPPEAKNAPQSHDNPNNIPF